MVNVVTKPKDCGEADGAVVVFLIAMLRELQTFAGFFPKHCSSVDWFNLSSLAYIAKVVWLSLSKSVRFCSTAAVAENVSVSVFNELSTLMYPCTCLFQASKNGNRWLSQCV